MIKLPLVLTLLAFPSLVSANVRICNTSDHQINFYAAVQNGFENERNQISLAGWYPVRPSGCRNLPMRTGSLHVGYYIAFANIDGQNILLEDRFLTYQSNGDYTDLLGNETRLISQRPFICIANDVNVTLESVPVSQYMSFRDNFTCPRGTDLFRTDFSIIRPALDRGNYTINYTGVRILISDG